MARYLRAAPKSPIIRKVFEGVIEGYGVATAAGVATAEAIGASTAEAVAASAGVATASAVGAASSAAAGTSAGVATAAAVGASTAAAAGSAAGVATAAAVGASIAEAVATSSGSSTATAVSDSDAEPEPEPEPVADTSGPPVGAIDHWFVRQYNAAAEAKKPKPPRKPGNAELSTDAWLRIFDVPEPPRGPNIVLTPKSEQRKRPVKVTAQDRAKKQKNKEDMQIAYIVGRLIAEKEDA